MEELQRDLRNQGVDPRKAEQIARDIAAGLPLGNGPQLSPSQRTMAGDDLNRLLRQGVGLHHSGLTFDQRTERDAGRRLGGLHRLQRTLIERQRQCDAFLSHLDIGVLALDADEMPPQPLGHRPARFLPRQR